MTLLLISVSFCGCVDSSDISVEKGNVEIAVATSYGSDDGNRMNFENACKEYESESGNIIKHTSAISNEAWKSRVIADFETGAEPDVLFFFTGADSNALVESSRVVSIDEIRSVYPDYASNMRYEMLEASPVDGKKYAVPVNGIWEGLYVNKKVLASCGVGVPGPDYMWDDFLSDCDIIAQNGFTPIAASLQDIPHYLFEFVTYNNGNTENHVLLPESSGDDIGEIWVSGLNDLKELYELGFLPDNTTTASDGEALRLMLDDKAAFMIDGSWRIGFFEENAPEKIGDYTVTYVPGKGERRATDIIAGLSMGYYITRKAWDNPEKQKACVDFVAHMTSDEVIKKFGSAAATLSALKDGSVITGKYSTLVRDALIMTRGCTSTVPPVQDRLGTRQRAYLFSNVKNIVDGGMTPGDAIDNCLAVAE